MTPVEKRTARIEVLVEPSLKGAATDFARTKDRSLSDILRQALVKATKWEAGG